MSMSSVDSSSTLIQTIVSEYPGHAWKGQVIPINSR